MKFRCECGKALQVPDDAAGKKVRCPACQAVLTAAPEEPIPIVEVVAPPPRSPVSPVRAVAPLPAPAPVVAPPPADLVFDEEPAEKPRFKKSKVVAEDDEPKSKKPWKKGDDKPKQPPVPPWAWVFVVACGAIPVVSLGGAIPAAVGFGGAGGCIGLARDAKKSVGVRVGGCVAITVVCWGLFAALVLAMS